jgi:UDP-glucose 4-epimerase
MKILITGGMGFIGHNVVRQLQDEHKITVYDSLTDYGILDPMEMHTLFKERKVGFNGYKVVGDIRDLKRLTSTFFSEKPEVVIHLASFPRGKVVNSNPILGAEVMSTALMNMLTTAKLNGVRRFVYISSSMVYGDFDNGVTEDAVCTPLGSYAILKYAGELLVKDYCRTHGMEYVIVRPSAVYGPRDVEDRVASKFLINAIRGQDITVRGASEVLDFTFVTDIANGICLAATLTSATDQTYNMTRGVGVSLLDAAKLAIKVTGSSSKIINADKDAAFPSRGTLSIGKANRELGYVPLVAIEEGFNLYYDWLKQK